MCMRASVSRKWKSSATMFRGHLDALHDESILISLYLARVMLPRLLSDRFVIIPTDFLVQNFNKIETTFQQVRYYLTFSSIFCSSPIYQIKSFQNFLRFSIPTDCRTTINWSKNISRRESVHIFRTFLEDQF